MCGGVCRVDRPLVLALASDFDAPPDEVSDVSNPRLLFDIVSSVGWGVCVVYRRVMGVIMVDKRSM
jgi:hypothetical protein